MVQRVKSYFVEALRELKRVIWPTRRDTIKNTALVIVISLAVAAFLGAIDYVFNALLERIV